MQKVPTRYIHKDILVKNRRQFFERRQIYVDVNATFTKDGMLLRILQATLASQDERSFRCRRAWLAPLIGVPLLAFYCTFGDILSNLIWCGMMIWLSFCAIRGLVYANGQTGTARNMRYYHIGVLCFAFVEYLLWTVGCFWPDTSLASPTFWCDMLLTLAILGLLPATRKAVDA